MLELHCLLAFLLRFKHLDFSGHSVIITLFASLFLLFKLLSTLQAGWHMVGHFWQYFSQRLSPAWKAFPQNPYQSSCSSLSAGANLHGALLIWVFGWWLIQFSKLFEAVHTDFCRPINALTVKAAGHSDLPAQRCSQNVEETQGGYTLRKQSSSTLWDLRVNAVRMLLLASLLSAPYTNFQTPNSLRHMGVLAKGPRSLIFSNWHLKVLNSFLK